MGGGRGAAGGILATEVCAPLLLLCWLCCWPDDAKSDASSGRHPGRAVVSHEGSRRRSSDFFGRRLGSSAVSLHLPSTSGHKKQPLSAHRSHEEIGRRKSHNEPHTEETRYHSAPSVIDEIIHRRDWERSTKDLYIPLKPDNEDSERNSSASDDTPDKPPHAVPESSSIEDCKNVEQIKRCKKHHTNIKSSRKKESTNDDVKDFDSTEISNFYIGETKDDNAMLTNTKEEDVLTKSIYKAKDAKQSFNESLKRKERPRQTLVPLDEHHPRMFQFDLNDVIEQLDRSGATHHSIESRISLGPRSVLPPPSVVPVGYDGGACYLAEVGAVAELRGARPGVSGGLGVTEGVGITGGQGCEGDGARGLRARHASDGDILATPLRPESGAFSESDLDLELECSEERPPPYDHLQHYIADHKETAI